MAVALCDVLLFFVNLEERILVTDSMHVSWLLVLLFVFSYCCLRNNWVALVSLLRQFGLQCSGVATGAVVFFSAI